MLPHVLPPRHAKPADRIFSNATPESPLHDSGERDNTTPLRAQDNIALWSSRSRMAASSPGCELAMCQCRGKCFTASPLESHLRYFCLTILKSKRVIGNSLSNVTLQSFVLYRYSRTSSVSRIDRRPGAHAAPSRPAECYMCAVLPSACHLLSDCSKTNTPLQRGLLIRSKQHRHDEKLLFFLRSNETLSSRVFKVNKLGTVLPDTTCNTPSFWFICLLLMANSFVL